MRLLANWTGCSAPHAVILAPSRWYSKLQLQLDSVHNAGKSEHRGAQNALRVDPDACAQALALPVIVETSQPDQSANSEIWEMPCSGREWFFGVILIFYSKTCLSKTGNPPMGISNGNEQLTPARLHNQEMQTQTPRYPACTTTLSIIHHPTSFVFRRSLLRRSRQSRYLSHAGVMCTTGRLSRWSSNEQSKPGLGSGVTRPC